MYSSPLVRNFSRLIVIFLSHIIIDNIGIQSLVSNPNRIELHKNCSNRFGEDMHFTLHQRALVRAIFLFRLPFVIFFLSFRLLSQHLSFFFSSILSQHPSEHSPLLIQQINCASMLESFARSFRSSTRQDRIRKIAYKMLPLKPRSQKSKKRYRHSTSQNSRIFQYCCVARRAYLPLKIIVKK